MHFEEPPERRELPIKLRSDRVVSRVNLARPSQPVVEEAVVLNLDHPAAIAVTNLEPDHRVSRKGQLKCGQVPSPSVESFELRHQEGRLANVSPSVAEALPVSTEVGAGQIGYRIELNP